MDLLPSIDELQEQLVAHDLAVRQIIALDHYIEQQNDLSSLSTTSDCPNPPFQQLIHTAVAEGIKRMYKEYRLQKWLKVQDMANTVRQILNPESSQYEEPNFPTELIQHGHHDNIIPYTPPVVTAEPVRPSVQEVTHISQVPSPLSRLLSPIGTPITDSLSEYRHHPDDHSSPIDTHRQLFPDRYCPDTEHRQQSSVSQQIDSHVDYSLQTSNSNTSTSQQAFQNFPHSTASERDQLNYVNAPAVLHYHDNGDNLNFSNPDQFDDAEEIMDWESDFDDSEENLAGVLFATQQLLPEEQATRLDVEMGDMGVGHVLFDRVSAAWQRYHCTYHRTS